MSKPDENAEFGEGNYQAAREFDASETEFVKKTGAAGIEAKAKQAAEALDGPEGDALRAAESETRAKGRD